MNGYTAKMNEYVNKFKAWWAPLAIREKQALVIGGICLALFIFYALIWSPLNEHAETLRKQIKTGQKTLQFMQSAEIDIAQSQGTVTQATPTSPVDFLSYFQQQLTTAGLAQAAVDIKQSSQDAITVKFAQVDMDRLLTLIISVMKAQRVSVEQFTAIAADSPGVANVELVLKLG